MGHRDQEPDDSTPGRPIRVLHVVAQLGRGGVETWLKGFCEKVDRRRVAVDVMVHTDRPQAYDEAIRATGARVIPCLHPARPWRYAWNFRRIMREFGPYDVVHSHVHYWNGVVLGLARWCGVPVRVAHSRVEHDVADIDAGVLRRLYRGVMGVFIRRCANAWLAVSADAGTGLFGERWRSDDRARMCRSGIDFDVFDGVLGADGLPDGLAGPARPPVIASIARFDPQKNHAMVFGVFEALAAIRTDAHLVLVGHGEREASIRGMIEASRFCDRIHLLGGRADVPALLRHTIDVLLLPSLFEGLPRVAIEAQAAGVPVVLSDTITRESAVIAELVTFMSLDDPPEAWAAVIAKRLAAGPLIEPEEALRRMRASEFSLERNVKDLEAFYLEAARRAGIGLRGRE